MAREQVGCNALNPIMHLVEVHDELLSVAKVLRHSSFRLMPQNNDGLTVIASITQPSSSRLYIRSPRSTEDISRAELEADSRDKPSIPNLLTDVFELGNNVLRGEDTTDEFTCYSSSRVTTQSLLWSSCVTTLILLMDPSQDSHILLSPSLRHPATLGDSAINGSRYHTVLIVYA